MILRNPKQEGSNLWDCKTQIGNCPVNCNQCFANRPGAAYIPMGDQILPTVEEVGDGIVRANCLHDSNIGREELIEHCKRYKDVFYNTSIPELNFPCPVVLTVNPKEEEKYSYLDPVETIKIRYLDYSKLMFVRFRVSASNLELIKPVMVNWMRCGITIVLTFMAYYESEAVPDKTNYEWKQRHINSYWCPTRAFMLDVLTKMKAVGGPLVTMCGTLDSHLCKDCRNCETYYWQAKRRLTDANP